MIFHVGPCPLKIRINRVWIKKQSRLLETKTRAFRGAIFSFVEYAVTRPLDNVDTADLAHDLSTAGPFERLIRLA
jgi:hypothetical protein